jgi:hypothetical protein
VVGRPFRDSPDYVTLPEQDRNGAITTARSQFLRLRVRYVKRADIHEAFLSCVLAVFHWPTTTAIRVKNRQRELFRRLCGDRHAELKGAFFPVGVSK